MNSFEPKLIFLAYKHVGILEPKLPRLAAAEDIQEIT